MKYLKLLIIIIITITSFFTVRESIFYLHGFILEDQTKDLKICPQMCVINTVVIYEDDWTGHKLNTWEPEFRKRYCNSPICDAVIPNIEPLPIRYSPPQPYEYNPDIMTSKNNHPDWEYSILTYSNFTYGNINYTKAQNNAYENMRWHMQQSNLSEEYIEEYLKGFKNQTEFLWQNRDIYHEIIDDIALQPGDMTPLK